MHFVKKVPTTDEEKLAKKKENDKRAKQYLAVRDRIVSKRANGEYDDEMLSLTQQVLEKNADIYTFWNIRRTTIEKRITENQSIQEDPQRSDEEKQKSQKMIDNLLSGELFLSFECIKGNPKSYSAWFQRAWVLKRQQQPDLEKELALCDKALKMDCRNFHCWDHRRIVAKMARRTEEQEFEYSNALIDENFSNYSAWHYRAIALQRLKTSESGLIQLGEETIAQELDKVKNAFYMDADDQSAWMYTRWLLQVGSGKEFLNPESTTPVKLLSASFHGNNTTLVFSRALPIEKVLSYVDTEDSNRWKAVSSTSMNATSSRVWQYFSTVPLRVSINEEDGKLYDIDTQFYVNKELMRKIYDSSEIVIPSAIKQLTEDCKTLIELEPKNKWPLYMKTLIQMEYDAVNSHQEIIENLKKLETLDENRAQLYKCLCSRQMLNSVVRETLESLMDGKTDGIVATYKNINSLEGIEYLSGLLLNIDLSGNNVSKIDRIVLPNVVSLTLNENPITELKSHIMTSIKSISVAGTEINDLNGVLSFLKSLPSLEKFIFAETPLVDHKTDIAEQIPNVRLIPYWL